MEKQITKEQVVTILNNAPQNLDKKVILQKLVEKGYSLEGFNMLQPQGFGDAGKDIKQIGTDVVSSLKTRGESVQQGKEAMKRGEQTGIETFGQTLGQGAGVVSDAIGSTIKGVTKAVLPQSVETGIKNTLGTGINATSNLVNSYELLKETKPLIAKSINIALGQSPDIVLGAKDIMDGYTKIKETNPRLARNIDGLLGITSLGLDVATGGVGESVAKTGVKAGANIIEQGTKKLVNTTDNLVVKGSGIPDTVAKFISPNIDEGTQTILKETPTPIFNKFEKIAKEASLDPRKPSVFEVVGDSVSNATKKLEEIKSKIGAKKSEYVSALRGGFDSFDNTPIIQNLTRLSNATTSKADKTLIDGLIKDAKNIKTVGSADKYIDNVQDILFKGSQDMTIPKGSSINRQLKGVVGEMNTQLKSQLPKEYSILNTQYSNLTKATNKLNKSLGDVVDGVSTRGAGLVKQFFSPSGTNAKQLFEFVKKTTGIDLAQESVVAKLMAELHGDVKARSLLQGIPQTKSGAVSSLIDFAVDKTGLGGALQDLSRKGAINKAKELTLPNK